MVKLISKNSSNNNKFNTKISPDLYFEHLFSYSVSIVLITYIA